MSTAASATDAAPEARSVDVAEIEREERAIYVIITAALSPVVASALLQDGAALDGGTTLSFLIVGLGVAGLVTGVRAVRSRLPRARARRRGAR